MVSALWKAEKIFCCVCLAVMVSVGFINVITRYVFHAALPWSEELIRYLFLWFTMVGASIGIKTGSHIGIGVITDRLNKKWQTIILILGILFCIFFMVMLFYSGISFLMKQGTQRSPAMQLPMLWVYLAFPVGAVLMTISFLSEIIKHIKSFHWKTTRIS